MKNRQFCVKNGILFRVRYFGAILYVKPSINLQEIVRLHYLNGILEFGSCII